MLSGGGIELIAGGLAVGATISKNGYEIVFSGAIDQNASVLSGGVELVRSGGVVSAATISSGTLTVSSGGVVTGGLVIDAGSAVIAGTVAAGQTISFGGSSGDLVLDNLLTIAGLTTASQKVDLAGFAYSSGETVSWSEAASNTSGTLTITDGAQVASLKLLGSYVTSNFTLSTDSAGGTYVVDPPLAGARSPHVSEPHLKIGGFIQAMAVLGAGASLGIDGNGLLTGGAAGPDVTSAVIPTAASGFGGG